jgi:hypothetical protein
MISLQRKRHKSEKKINGLRRQMHDKHNNNKLTHSKNNYALFNQ